MTNLENITAGNVKAAMKAVGASSQDLWAVDVASIRVLDGFNVRAHNPEYDAHIEAHIEALTTSTLENGFMKDKPLAGYVARVDGLDVVYITDGHSRLEAVKKAIERGALIATLPVVTKPNGTSLEDLTVGLVTSNSGRPLMPIEKAEVVKRLVGYGMPEATIASRLGFTLAYIKDLLTLIAAPKNVRDMVIAGSVSADNAVQAIKRHKEKAGPVLTEKLADAKAIGKTRITQKTLDPKRDILADGVAFMRQGATSAISLLAHLTGKTPDEVAKLVEAKAG